LSIFIKKDGKNKVPRLVYIKILVFFVLVAVSAVALKPIQTALAQEMQRLRVEFIEKLEEYTGLNIHYSSLRPSFFGSFDIRNLSFKKGEIPLFTVYRVRIHYSIIELLLKKKTFIRTVQIVQPEINIDTEKDKETIDILTSLIKAKENDNETTSVNKLSDFLPRNADYQIQHLNINIVDGYSAYKIENMNLNLKENKGKVEVFGRFYAEVKLADILEKTIIIATDAGLNGTYSTDLNDGNAEVSVYYMTCSQQDGVKKSTSFFNPPVNNVTTSPLFNMIPFNINIFYNNDTFTVNSPAEDNTFFFQYNIGTKDVSAEVQLDNFKPSEILIFPHNMNNVKDLLSMQITGNSSLSYENERLNYVVDINGLRGENSADSILIDIYGNDKSAVINNFRLAFFSPSSRNAFFSGAVQARGNIGFSPLTCNGNLSFDRFSLTGDEDVNAVFNVSTNKGEVHIAGEQIKIARAQFDNMDIFLYPSQKDTVVTASAFIKDKGDVYLDAVYSNDPRQLEATLALDSVSLFEIAEVFRPFSDDLNLLPAVRPLLKDSSINTEIFFSTDFNNIVYNAPSIEFNIGSKSGLLSLSGTDRQFTLSEGIFKGSEHDFYLSANINFANPMELVFKVNANYQDLAWNVDGQILDRNTLIISDPAGLHVYGNASSSGAISGYVEGIDYPIPVNSKPVYLNFYTTLRFNARDFWNVDVNRFAAREANSPAGNDFLKITGAADQKGANFKDILYNDAVGTLTGKADFGWDIDFSTIEFFIDITDGKEAGEFYFFDGIFRDEHISLDMSVSNMHVNRFVKLNTPVLISADAAVLWDSIESFNARLNLISLASRVGNDPVQMSVIANVSNDELIIRNLKMDYAKIRVLLPELVLSRSEGTAMARADIQGYANGKRVEGKMEFDANFGQVDSWLELTQAVNNFDGTLKFTDIVFGKMDQDEFLFEFAGNEGAISLSGGVKDMIRLEMDSDGNFFMGLSDPVPIRGAILGTFKDGILDARCNNFYIDMPSLWALTADEQEFSIAGGYVSGQIDIRGPVGNPEFFGTARGTSFRFLIPNYLPEELRAAPFNVLAEGYEMTFGPVVTVSGSGSANLNGWFIFENWAPVNTGLDISIPRETPIPYDINVVGFLANGTASGNLNFNFNGMESLIELRGSLLAHETELGLNMDEIGVITEAENPDNMTINMIVELAVTTGSMVEFVWPTNSPILRANPEMGTVIRISSDSQAGQFSLISDVKIRSGELNYFDRTFYIRQGSIVFRENETQFDPRLTARAEIRDRSESGPVTISMVIDNQPLFSFQPRFEAYPSLTQLEIYSMLGQNFNIVQGDENSEEVQRLILISTTDLLTQFITSSDVFAQFVSLRQFERKVRDLFGLDMFSVRTRFLQNAVVTGASNLGQTPVDRSNSVGNYFDNTTVFIGKYIGQDMFIQGTLTMRYDENSTLLGGLTFEPDIGIELNTPFVNIRWDFFPYHPENLWVSDNSITLSWSKSF
jgi:hypothetical protein